MDSDNNKADNINPVIRADNIFVELNKKTVLSDISFTINRGDAVGIIGPNGAGKTTLLRLLLGLIPATGGRITILGKDSAHLGKKRTLIGYLPQRPAFERRFPVSVRDVVIMGLLPLKTPALLWKNADLAPWVEKALSAVNMENFLHRPFQALSGGEQQRVLLARALVHNPCILFLDEPVTGLDYPARNSFMELLDSLKQQMELTVLLVSHDLKDIASYTTSLICINKTMHIHGNSAEVLQSPRLQEAYRCQFDFMNKTDDNTPPHGTGKDGNPLD